MPEALAKKFNETNERAREGKGDFGDVLVNRGTAFVTTAGLGGTIAHFAERAVDYRWPALLAEGDHAHFVALVIFLWQTFTFSLVYIGNGIGSLWSAIVSRIRKNGGSP